jgi:hypothetical protein
MDTFTRGACHNEQRLSIIQPLSHLSFYLNRFTKDSGDWMRPARIAEGSRAISNFFFEDIP